jgi:hypothetical protein
MHIYWEIEYIRKEGGESVHSDICQDPESDDVITLSELYEEIVRKADMTKPWRLESHGVCAEHT